MGSSASDEDRGRPCACVSPGRRSSGVLLGQHHGETWAVSTVNEACGDGQTSGCEDVARSSWSSFAGLPVAAYGLAFYLSLSLLLALALLAPADLRDSLAGVAARRRSPSACSWTSLLLGVQAFAIHAVLRALHPDLPA